MTVPVAAEVIERARAACRAVFPGTRIFLAYAYGSRVRGTARSDSDLDIGYYLNESRSTPLSMTEEMMVADRLSRQLGMEVDLRNLGGAPLEWRARVLQEGRRLYCTDEPTRVAIERDLMTRWFDERPRLDRIHAERLTQFAATGLAAGLHQ
jgi:predicted nucleotidyltransferase